MKPGFVGLGDNGVSQDTPELGVAMPADKRANVVPGDTPKLPPRKAPA
jgi:hypothetical protein